MLTWPLADNSKENLAPLELPPKIFMLWTNPNNNFGKKMLACLIVFLTLMNFYKHLWREAKCQSLAFAFQKIQSSRDFCQANWLALSQMNFDI